MSPTEQPCILKRDAALLAATDLLGPEAYTTQRLRHADSEHLHLTARRCFIGPIPEGWLKSHRKQWYKHYLGINHSSKVPSFSASSNVTAQRRVTGIDNDNVRPSFPVPADALDGAAPSSPVIADEEPPAALGETDNRSQEALTEAPPAETLPRAEQNPSSPILKQDSASIPDAPISKVETGAPQSSRPTHKKKVKSKKPRLRREESGASYRTAHEYLSDSDEPGIEDIPEGTERPSSQLKPSPQSPALSGRDDSTAPLLNQELTGATLDETTTDVPESASAPQPHATFAQDAKDHAGNKNFEAQKAKAEQDRARIKAQFPERRLRAQMVRIGMNPEGRIMSRHHNGTGQIVKMEKMLLRIDLTTGADQPEPDFAEKDSQHIETRVIEKWREFMVVCRESESKDVALVLQMYQTRVIPASGREAKRHFKHELRLDRHKVQVSLYSSLDKTIAIYQKEGNRTRIHFLRTRSGASAVEWYHFFRQVLGLVRDRNLEIHVPDLNASVRLDDPFMSLFTKEDIEKAAAGDEETLIRTAKFESAVAQNIINRCLELLAKGTEWRDVLTAWTSQDHIGLAWRRYDRLEWVHGGHERRMYGAYAMVRSHELELRVKQHYAHTAKTRRGKTHTEPAPVEGFLIRLTSQKGSQQKMGKFFYKRLYYATHNQFLLFMRPSKALPPPPPKLPMTKDSAIPSTEDLAQKIPLIYAVNPYPLKDKKVSWVIQSDDRPAAIRDEDACDEAQRNIAMIHSCEGFINLCDVVKVRRFTPDDTTPDDDESGSDVDFDENANDTSLPDGVTSDLDADRTFELLLRNGLVVRLQTFNTATCLEWMSRLRQLSKYWRARIRNDMDLFKSVRAENLRALNIDERAEAYVGQFAHKWEVTTSFASPELYHMCGIAGCRAIHNAGVLYRKPRVHATFTRCYAILCSGKLLLFQDTLRGWTGAATRHIHHSRIATLDLGSCYLYSGLITEDDLLAQNTTFDPDHPGRSALPRVFREDKWMATDEDAMTTFVLWHGQKKGWFRSPMSKEGKDKGRAHRTLSRVNQLGTTGRSVVFKARSRAERDHWVSAIGAEIEKHAADDGVRVEEDA